MLSKSTWRLTAEKRSNKGALYPKTVGSRASVCANPDVRTEMWSRGEDGLLLACALGTQRPRSDAANAQSFATTRVSILQLTSDLRANPFWSMGHVSALHPWHAKSLELAAKKVGLLTIMRGKKHLVSSGAH